MSNIIPFKSDEFSVRVVVLDGVEWFVGKDVAEELGYVNESDAMNRHCRGVVKRYPIPDALGRMQDTRLLAEPDLYRMVVASNLPAAERFERWVFEDVLPSIRKTGGYAASGRRDGGQAPTTPGELFLQSAQAIVALEQEQAQQRAALERVESRVEQVAAGISTLTQRPAGSEAITHIRPRILKLYGIPARVVDLVMRQLPYSPKPAGMVRHTREEAEGGAYAVYWSKDVNTTFRRFVGECTRVTRAFATHPDIEDRFRLAPGVEAKEAA